MKLQYHFILAILAMFISGTPLWGQEHEGREAIDMVILMDRSGSMNEPMGDPRGLSRAAVEFLLDQLELSSTENRAALVLFASKTLAVPATGLTSNLEELRANLGLIGKINSSSPVGLETDLEMAISEGLRLLAEGSGGKKEIVLISDGKPMPDPRILDSKVIDRFPELYRKFHDSKSKDVQDNYREKINQASIENIVGAQFGALRETGVEVFPVALSGMQSAGEDLLKKMAVEVTRDESAFIKIKGNDMVSALDQIVPKPENLVNIHRDSLRKAGQNSWQTAFGLKWPLEQMRILILYSKTPPADLKWEMRTPQGTISPANMMGGRYAVVKDQNGEGEKIFERIFLDNPLSGGYSLSLKTNGFLEPFDVIIEGRTGAKILLKVEPDPPEVGLPMNVFFRIAGGSNLKLEDGKAKIINENGQEIAKIDNFRLDSNEVLNASWIPSLPGEYKMKFTGFVDVGQKQYISTQRKVQVKPKEAVNLQIIIPTP